MRRLLLLTFFFALCFTIARCQPPGGLPAGTPTSARSGYNYGGNHGDILTVVNGLPTSYSGFNYNPVTNLVMGDSIPLFNQGIKGVFPVVDTVKGSDTLFLFIPDGTTGPFIITANQNSYHDLVIVLPTTIGDCNILPGWFNIRINISSPVTNLNIINGFNPKIYLPGQHTACLPTYTFTRTRYYGFQYPAPFDIIFIWEPSSNTWR